jgi:hypothetical protein
MCNDSRAARAAQPASTSPICGESVDSGGPGDTLNSCPQSLTSASSAAASVPLCRGSGEPPPAAALTRVSARLQVQGVRHYTAADGWWASR